MRQYPRCNAGDEAHVWTYAWQQPEGYGLVAGFLAGHKIQSGRFAKRWACLGALPLASIPLLTHLSVHTGGGGGSLGWSGRQQMHQAVETVNFIELFYEGGLHPSSQVSVAMR